VIAVEHKINHTVGNDLAHYEQWAKKQYPNHVWYGVILHTKPLVQKDIKNFTALPHSRWQRAIQETFKEKTLRVAPGFQFNFFQELLTTLERIEKGATMNQESSEFLASHAEEIRDINKIVGIGAIV
jgi:hypothetical protein